MSNFLNAGLIHTGSAFRLWQSAKIENTYILATRTLTLFTLAKSNAVQTKGQFSIVQDCFFVYTAIDCSLKNLTLRQTEIEQNRCAMACQGCSVIFYIFKNRQ